MSNTRYSIFIFFILLIITYYYFPKLYAKKDINSKVDITCNMSITIIILSIFSYYIVAFFQYKLS